MTLDKENMKAVLTSFSQQCVQASQLGKTIKLNEPFSAIVFGGVGGSALPSDIIQEAAALSIPIINLRDYTLPIWVKSDALVFIVSYSGNTEEALSVYEEALQRKCQIVSISCGGKLQEYCRKNNTPHILVPKGIQPRDALGYQTIPILNVLMENNLIPSEMGEEIQQMIPILSADYRLKAKELAQKMMDKIPIIYASKRLSIIARVWKTKINENAKVQAFWNEFPELNHNEMVGYTNRKADFFVVIIEDEVDHPRNIKRMQITKKLLQDKGVSVSSLRLTGKNTIAKIFSAILLGSWVGYELALLYGVDPSPVVMVEDLKKELEKN